MWLVAGLLVGIVLHQTSSSELQSALSRAALHKGLLVWAIVLPGIAVLVSVWRWRTLLGAFGFQPRFRSLLKAFLVGAFFNQLLPSTVGGDVVRGWRVRGEANGAASSISVVALDRVVGLAGIIATVVCVVLVQPQLVAASPRLLHILSFLVIAGGVLVVARSAGAWSGVRGLADRISPRAAHVLSSLEGAALQLKSERGRVLFAGLLSVAVQFVLICDFYVLSQLYHGNLSLLQACLVTPLVNLSTSVPISINGIGVREGVLALLGSSFGLTVAGATAMAWTFVGVSLLYALIGGAIYFVDGFAEGRP